MRSAVLCSPIILLTIVLVLVQIIPGINGVVLGAVDPSFDPHDDKPENCLVCHTKVPTAEEVENEELFLIEDTIDGTCHSCHPYDCCRINSLKGHNHPSNVNKWDVDEFTEPQTLPLHDGYITCNTCHFHLRPTPSGYKMVRIVEAQMNRIDWTNLCSDCHREY